MVDENAFIISDSGNTLVIKPYRRTHPECTDYWDGNWVRTKIDLRVGCFQASVDADLRVDELASFRNQLDVIYNELKGEAQLTSLEHWIELRILGDGLGHFDVRGSLRDEPSFGNVLHFRLYFDQTSIPEMITNLDRIFESFPIFGRRDG